MARRFTSVSTEYLYVASAPVTNHPMSVSLWYYQLTQQSTVLFQMGDKDVADKYWQIGLANSDPAVVRATARFTTSRAAEATDTAALNAWHHVVGIFTNDNSRDIFLDGGNKGSNADAATPDAVDSLGIGMARDFTPGYPLDGYMAEVAIWQAALTDAEGAILALGYSPLFVRPQNLVFYAPLIRGLNDRKGLILTASGTTVSAHDIPGLKYPAPQFISFPVVGVPPAAAITVLAAAYLLKHKKAVDGQLIPGVI